MSLCDSCRSPGHCCSGFVLSRPDGTYTNWDSDSREEMNAAMGSLGLPFRAIAIRERWTQESTGLAYNTWRWGCPKLGDDGRCTIYSARPNTCRDYEAGSSALCAEYPPHLKGIPIRVEHA